jgi:hypothetical protein
LRIGREEHRRPGVGQGAGGLWLLMGDTDDDLVHERVAEPGPQGVGQPGFAGQVGVERRHPGGQLGHRVVGEHRVVATQALGEGDVAR